MRLGERAKYHRLVTVELIPDRVVPGDLALLRGSVDAITVPALRNGDNDPSYPEGFRITPQHRSLASAAIINRAGITAVPSLTCRDCRRADLARVSDQVENGLENVLIVYGDPYPEARPGTFEFSKTSDLIREISQSNNGRAPCIGAVTNQHADDREKEVSRTMSKVDAGADYVITNVALDSNTVLDHRDSLLDAGLDVPLFIQISIPVSLDNVLFVGRKFGIPVPANVQKKLADDPAGGSVTVAKEAYESLYREASGIHFSYLFRHRNPIPTYRHLLEKLGIAPPVVAPLIASPVKTHSIG